MDNETICKLITFGEVNENIRALILEGSHATERFLDDLSDFDVNIFTNDSEPFLQSAGWLSQFGEVMIYQKEELKFYGQAFPSRLVVFRDGSRIDFSFWPVSALRELADGRKRYESYHNGFRVLVDKDGFAANLSEPDGMGFQVTHPDRDRFLKTIYDFWFEAYCVARGLARGDLWYAKRIEGSYLKDHLYQMILWEHQSRHGWAPDLLLHLDGKRFERWAEPQLLKEISGCFSAYSIDAAWKSLFAMLELFNKLARGLAADLGIEFPENKYRYVMGCLESLKIKK